ncbi:MAG: YwiC-like family protein [Actinomyces sp.]|uniref:YwiC-like family protein n=1 Tax=Actinomyces sp. TaxID=29317 RepID=UPI0026DCE493|nr:YwiC-like family protein [Actinomyces sp.]MDO4242713.1 YwiC-like family protein [Actinomyces sp.]
MTQQRPSDPSQRHVEYVSDEPEAEPAAAPPASPGSEDPADGRERAAIPHQQSRPGPEDDRLLATGERVRPSSARQGETGPTPRPTQEEIRRQPGRRAWVPQQHGAWSMLIVPPLVGWVVGGVSWVNLVLLPAWWGAYFAYWAWSQWLRTRSARKRALLVLPLGVYTAWTAGLALLTIVAAPYLIEWVVPLAPLLALAAHQVWRGHERSLASGLATTAAASLMAAVTYSVAVDGAGGFLGTGAAVGLPGASPNGELAGWSWMWLVTGLTAAYFCGTVPYIKAMIRERFNTPLLACTVATHAAVAATTVWLAAGGYVSWAMAALWVVLAVRSLVMPLLQWHLARSRHRPLRPGVMGVVEIVMCVLLLISIAVA